MSSSRYDYIKQLAQQSGLKFEKAVGTLPKSLQPEELSVEEQRRELDRLMALPVDDLLAEISPATAWDALDKSVGGNQDLSQTLASYSEFDDKYFARVEDHSSKGIEILSNYFKKKLEPHFSSAAFSRLFVHMEIQSVDHGQIVMSVPSLMAKRLIRAKYMDKVRSVSREVFGDTPELKIVAKEAETILSSISESDLDAWGRARERLRIDVGIDVFSSWFSALEFAGRRGRNLFISTPVKFLKKWLENHYMGNIQESCQREFNSALSVQIVLRNPSGSGPVARDPRPQSRLHRIRDVVSEHCGVGVEDILSTSRQRGPVNARHIAMYLGHKLTGNSLIELGNFFGRRDHTTVLHAIRKMENELYEGSLLGTKILELKRLLAFDRTDITAALSLDERENARPAAHAHDVPIAAIQARVGNELQRSESINNTLLPSSGSYGVVESPSRSSASGPASPAVLSQSRINVELLDFASEFVWQVQTFGRDYGTLQVECNEADARCGFMIPGNYSPILLAADYVDHAEYAGLAELAGQIMQSSRSRSRYCAVFIECDELSRGHRNLIAKIAFLTYQPDGRGVSFLGAPSLRIAPGCDWQRSMSDWSRRVGSAGIAVRRNHMPGIILQLKPCDRFGRTFSESGPLLLSDCTGGAGSTLLTLKPPRIVDR